MSKVKTFAKVAAFASFLGFAGWGAYEILRPAYTGNAGITYGSAYAETRDQNVDFHIWYPANPGGKSVTVGGNGVFHGTPAGRGAPHRGGRFPMIVMSHGAGGNAGQFGWIASKLAGSGYVVVLPNHPGTTTGNASAEAAVRGWERPADVSAVLDEITSRPDAYPYIDTTRIGTLGFSAGGYTAMAIIGARIDPDRLQTFCDETDHGMSDCAFFEHFGIDLHELDLSPAAQDLEDARVTSAVIVDPGIVSTMTAHSLSQITVPTLMLNLGEQTKVPAGVYALPAANLMQNTEHVFVPDTTHFSFLAECKSGGPAMLKAEGELDPLCEDGGEQTRPEIHADLTKKILAHFQEQL